MKGKCPFGKIKCHECVLYRTGLRYWDSGPKAGQNETFEECAITIGIDCLENLVTRMISQQKATEETRNQITELKQLFLYLASQKTLEKKENSERIEVIDAEVTD